MNDEQSPTTSPVQNEAQPEQTPEDILKEDLLKGEEEAMSNLINNVISDAQQPQEPTQPQAEAKNDVTESPTTNETQPQAPIAPVEICPNCQSNKETVNTTEDGKCAVCNRDLIKKEPQNEAVNVEVISPDKQDTTSQVINPMNRNPSGKGGFADHPELINREGRPKRKTVLELLNDKLDQPLPSGKIGQEAVVDAIIGFLLGKKIKIKTTDKDGNVTVTEKIIPPDKDMLKEYWHYNDGMPQQEQVMKLDNDAKIIVTRQ